ncbi:MAG: hypothetical protein KatS3mg121_0637 [Gammaproteobacteria bacterium]|nr:MAG: hypothetical protein KatS3mg121_0637 [Gammaproteobacteria bacterium]
MDVVAHAGAVGGGVVGPVDRHLRPLARRRLAGHLDQQRRLARRLADAQPRVGAGHVEIAQRDVPRAAGRGQVREHRLGHPLGTAVGVDRRRRRVLVGDAARRNAVDRRRGGEHEMFDAVADAGFQQVARGAGVVAVILERVRHRFGHDGVRGEVHHRPHGVLAQQARDPIQIAAVADHQFAVQHRRPEAGGQIVQHHHLFAGFAELPDHVAADVAGAAGHQNRAFGHRRSLPGLPRRATLARRKGVPKRPGA